MLNRTKITYLIAIGVSQLAGVIGSIFTLNAIPNWYAYLEKPFFNPPNWIFGPVWTTLYTLMGIAAGMIFLSKSRKRKDALYLFGAQLFLNAIWSIIFFGVQDLLWSILVIIMLDITVFLTIKDFYKINKKAAYLLLPYLAWILFATLLNISILLLN